MHGLAGHLCDTDVSSQLILHHTTRGVNAIAVAEAHLAMRGGCRLEVNVAVSVRRTETKPRTPRPWFLVKKMTKTEPEMEMVELTQP